VLSDRSEWVDILKGIGISLIVIGHIVSGPLRDFLYLFHVPIFFFLSGYLFKPPINKKSYILQKIRRLMIPYFSFLFGFTILLMLSELLVNNDTENFHNLVESAVLGGQNLTGWFSVFWFITSLFFTQIIYVHLQGLNKRLFYFCVFMSLVLAYVTSIYTPGILPFWSLNTILFTLPIYFVGNFCASYRVGLLLRCSIFATVLFLPIYYIYPDLHNMDIKETKYGVPIIGLILSLALVVITFSISKLIKAPRILANSLAYLGGISMTIMYMHQPIQISLKHMLNLQSPIFLIIVTLLLCMMSHEMFRRYAITSKYLLGNKHE
jgi:fucose 4-O-acetylase-like acetyltransferase